MKFTRTQWPKKPKQVPEDLKPYWGRKDTLSEVNGVIMSGDRVVIPETLRKQVLNCLHKGHPCADQMKSIARTVVYWKNIDKDLENIAKKCPNCAAVAKTPVKTTLRS